MALKVEAYDRKLAIKELLNQMVKQSGMIGIAVHNDGGTAADRGLPCKAKNGCLVDLNTAYKHVKVAIRFRQLVKVKVGCNVSIVSINCS